MATQDKLIKSLEILKALSTPNLDHEGMPSRKKDKIHHCSVITEAISSSTIRIAPNFNQLLSITIEVLLQLCDDQESDVRMIADECLNRIIRAMSNSNISKVIIELHKEVKKDGPARSLRAALWRFAQLAHYIRPHKGRPYIINLMPCIVKISERAEDPVHETLANSLPKIMAVLGCYTTDNDIKTLLKAFLANISNSSAVIRRSAASCILSVCLNCRKPYVFISYVLNNVTDLLIPVKECPNVLVIGVMGCLKLILPHVNNTEKGQEIQGSFGVRKGINETPLAVDRLLQIYELCLFYILNNDHNIINASLETLNVLLQNCPMQLKTMLLSSEGLNKSRIYNFDKNSKYKLRSPSVLSVATLTSGDDNARLENDLTETTQADIEKWINESTLSVGNVIYAKTKEFQQRDSGPSSGLELGDSSSYSDLSATGRLYGMSTESIKSDSVYDNLDKLVLSETSSEKSLTQEEDDKLAAVDGRMKEIDIGEFRDKEISLIYCTRLLVKNFLLSGYPGSTIPDKTVRVSVKSLALSCLSTICNLYPRCLVMYLEKNVTDYENNQKITDVLIYATHSDPQLRGGVRILVGNFIKMGLIESGGRYAEWLNDFNEGFNVDNLKLDFLIKDFITGLEDESSNCTRQTLQGLSICLRHLIESEDSPYVIPLLHVIPLVANNLYWLVKVKLAEILSEMSYITVQHITGSCEFQNKVIHNVLCELLRDSDQRVRAAASKALVKIIPSLYFEQFCVKESTISSKGIFYKKLFLNNLKVAPLETNLNRKHFLQDMPFPYNSLIKENSPEIDYSLSKIVNKLYNFLFTCTSKHFMSGCIETLSLLAETYPCTMYPDAWSCFKNIIIPKEHILRRSNSKVMNTIPENTGISSAAGLLSSCVCFLTTSVIGYDLSCHQSLLKLCSNLFAGISVKNLKPPDIILEEVHPLWDVFSDKILGEVSESLLNHVVKLLSVFHHVLDEIVPILPQNKPVLPNLPSANSLSPIKRRKSDLDKSKLISSGKFIDKDEKTKSEINSMGYFANIPYYMKLYDLFRTAYTNYKVTLEAAASDKFLSILRTTLRTLSVILEIGTLNEFGRISEEILNYLRSTFLLEPTISVECVHQLLKCLFGTNLTVNMGKVVENPQHNIITNKENNTYGFYYNLYQKPYEDLSSCINALSNIHKIECDDDTTVMGYLHRRESKKSVTFSRGSDKILASYIRMFEPMVIKALKQYTITSDVKLQCRVLQLLSLLVQLKVNYCLLDADQIFIGFVLKQFAYIEEGQISYPEEIIPSIFNFLVHLSYGKHHSKSIISVPKIIQLCDELMASGQSLLTHCIPALEPIVEDIFLIRNKSNTPDFKELETMREFLLSMLLRLLEYHEVIELLALILNESKYCIDDNEKWGRWSRQVMDVFLPMLKENKIQLVNIQAMEAVNKLIFVLNPSVFKPINNLLLMMFQEPPYPEDSSISVNLWFSKITVLFLLITQVKEDILILKIMETQEEFAPRSIFENVETTADPLNVTITSNILDNIPPEIIFVRYIFRLVEIVSKRSLDLAKNEEDVFLINQFSALLIHFLYIFQSGSHCKIANAAIKVLNETNSSDVAISEINENFLKLKHFFPTLVFEWCYFLTLLNYNDRNFWANVLQIADTSDGTKNSCKTKLKKQCINMEVVRYGASVVFCDFLNENLSDSTQLSWMITNNIELLVKLQEEPPVVELLSSIHRSSTSSGLVIRAVSQTCTDNSDPTFKSKCLKIIENCHPQQIGALLNFLLPKLLNSRQLSLSRLVSNLASRKIELLLTMSMEEVNNQLSRENLTKILETLVKLKLAKKHETLTGLLNKLATQFYDLSPLDFNQRRTINPEYIKKLSINKTWYLSQVHSRCCNGLSGPESAELLSKLEYNELMDVMTHKDFNKLILKECIIWGGNLIKKVDLDEEPTLLKAAISCLLENVSAIGNLPKPHQVYRVTAREQTASETKYSEKVTEIFSEHSFCCLLYETIPSVTNYIEFLPIFPKIKIPDANLEDIIKFAVVCLEFINFLIDTDKNTININFIDMALRCVNEVLKEPHLCSILALTTHVSWLCSAISSVYKLIDNFLLQDDLLPSVPKTILSSTLRNPETLQAGHACYQTSVLIAWLERTQNVEVNIPSFLLKPIKSIVISLARLPLVNSFALIPPVAWKSGLSMEPTGSFNTQFGSLPADLLQEKEVLEEYIFRITLLGWTNRQQFEETWVSLLSVLCYNPLSDSLDDVNLAAQATSLTVQAITSLLIKTFYHPLPGNHVSKLIHVSRDKQIKGDKISIKKLEIVHNNLYNKYLSCCDSTDELDLHNIFENVNMEKQNDKFTLGQVSVEYLLLAARVVDHFEYDNRAAEVYKEREKMLENSGLDINSCLQFLLDLYTPWIKGEASVHQRMIHEVVRSLLIISDLFTDRSQFAYMLDSFLDLSKIHMIENEILHQYVIIGICKTSAVLAPDLETYEVIKKLLNSSLKSSFLPPRIASLHSILYVIQGCLLSNTVIGGISEEMQLILPIAVDYVQTHLNTSTSMLKYSQQHNMLVWALAFYLIENVDESHMEANFIANVLQAALHELSLPGVTCVTNSILKGIERLLLVKKSVLVHHEKRILNLALENLKSSKPSVAIPGFQLLLTYMYTDCADHIEKVVNSSERVQSNPDHLMHTIEKISAIFDRIRKGHVFEVEIMCSVLPNILNDFFTPSDILTKVIGEFLSIQQPHPKLLSTVVFQVFKTAIGQSQLPLLQDWVVFSLSNFTQSLSLGMATWCLTCFFISASTNEYLRSFFPHVQSRMGRYEYEDKKMLCIAGSDFYKNLTSDKQKQTFINNFGDVKNQSDMPFVDLLASL